MESYVNSIMLTFRTSVDYVSYNQAGCGGLKHTVTSWHKEQPVIYYNVRVHSQQTDDVTSEGKRTLHRTEPNRTVTNRLSAGWRILQELLNPIEQCPRYLYNCQRHVSHARFIKRREAQTTVLPENRLVLYASHRANVRQVDGKPTFLSTHLRGIIQD
jgi:hypothetical protein